MPSEAHFPIASALKRPAAGARPRPRAQRAWDITLASAFLLAFALPMALIALAIRLDSPGPALFRQHRIGRHGQTFLMVKFRTMSHTTEQGAEVVQATPQDPRITRLGALLRRSSLDELPQLFNVLRGDMALVGPRPHAPFTLAGGFRFEDLGPAYAARHTVLPGITGLAQIRGLRGETRTQAQLQARVDADLEYIARQSWLLDCAILARTAWCVLSMRNAH